MCEIIGMEHGFQVTLDGRSHRLDLRNKIRAQIEISQSGMSLVQDTYVLQCSCDIVWVLSLRLTIVRHHNGVQIVSGAWDMATSTILIFEMEQRKGG
jgi:hypothetical protein